MNFAYYLFLLLIIFLSIFIMKKNLKVSPKKIKIYLSIVITLFFLRHIALFFLCILENSTVIYYLKSLIFLDHISIPLMILAMTYVYLRAENLKFAGSYIIALVIAMIYVFIMENSKVTIQVSYLYGFILGIDKELILFLFSLILLGVLLILNVILLDKPFANKKGIGVIILSILIVMAEEIIILGGMRVFPYSVIGELIFIILMNWVLNGFRSIKT